MAGPGRGDSRLVSTPVSGMFSLGEGASLAAARRLARKRPAVILAGQPQWPRGGQAVAAAHVHRSPPVRDLVSTPPTVPGSRPGCLRPQARTGSIARLNPGRLSDDAHRLVRRYLRWH